MKELSNITSNIFFSEDAGEVSASIELIITVSEPVHKCDDTGTLVRYRQIETLRFSSQLSGIENLAEYLTARIKDAKDAENRINGDSS